MVTPYYVKWLLYGVQTERSTVKSGQWSSLIQQELLETLYVGQASIKPVHKRKFYSKSSAVVITPDTSQKLTLPSFPKKKDYLADCPSNVPHYAAMVRGSWGLVSSSGYPQHFSYSWQPNTLNLWLAISWPCENRKWQLLKNPKSATCQTWTFAMDITSV